MFLFGDGADGYATADLGKKYTSISSSTGLSVSAEGRRGGNGLRCAGSGQGATKGLPGSYGTLIVGAAVKGGAGTPTTGMLEFAEAGTTHINLAHQADGTLSVNRAGTLLGSSIAGVLPFGTFKYVEIKLTISDTIGAVTVRVDGEVVLSLTNVDTRNGGTGVITSVRFQSLTSGDARLFDDIYICDTSGPDCNDFLGDVAIELALPAGEGTHQAFTPSSGTAHWDKVADTVPNTTTFVSSATVGAKETYQMGDLLPRTGTIKAIQVTTMALKDDAGLRTIANLIRSGTTEQEGPTVALSTSQTGIISIHERDPATNAAWTEAGVNALEAGVVVKG